MKPHLGQRRRPLIGITPDVSVAATKPPQKVYELKASYAHAVLRAGGVPVILPYVTAPEDVDAILERLGGLVVSGGAFDIPPSTYGETPREGLGDTKPERTQFEAELLRVALRRGVPVLGVCGGMQLLNVVCGGTLIQDLPKELAHAQSHQQHHERDQPHHPVDIKENTVLAKAVGRGQLMVNSTHHQAVKAVGKGLSVSAVAPDGVIEAIESLVPYALGVQWHPELLIESVPPHLGVYAALVQRARERR